MCPILVKITKSRVRFFFYPQTIGLPRFAAHTAASITAQTATYALFICLVIVCFLTLPITRLKTENLTRHFVLLPHNMRGEAVGRTEDCQQRTLVRRHAVA